MSVVSSVVLSVVRQCGSDVVNVGSGVVRQCGREWSVVTTCGTIEVSVVNSGLSVVSHVL